MGLINTPAPGRTRLMHADLGDVWDTIRITGPGLDVLAVADRLPLRDAQARVVAALTPRPRPALRIERTGG
jgi:hypothetical protein